MPPELFKIKQANQNATLVLKVSTVMVVLSIILHSSALQDSTVQKEHGILHNIHALWAPSATLLDCLMQRRVYCALEENTVIKLGSHNQVEHVMQDIIVLKALNIQILSVTIVRLVFIALLAVQSHGLALGVLTVLNFSRHQWMTVCHALEDHTVRMRMLPWQLDCVNRDITAQQIVKHITADGWFVQLGIIVPLVPVHHCLVQLVHFPIPLALTLLQIVYLVPLAITVMQ